MKFGVVIFPGSNCDMDIFYVLKNILKQNVVKLWHKETDLQGVDFIVIPGGFSYGDYLRSGAIAKFSPIMNQIIGFANSGGYVLGICNGFQILTESQLLPGALLHNTSHKFICKNIYLKVSSSNTLITNLYSTDPIKIPIAHGEGRYYANQKTINELVENDQILFNYCDQKGYITEESNPNGSILNIAGICNIERNVFGMMPHPERASDAELNNQDGKILFNSIITNFI
ncbi:MAG: phosphoribosylformylglycinamidine synthase I [Flavobacteriales bacterium]|nr:phosphoribosylformylglycinamidine synthase I [Flavobacteriales bacterium]|tara:strand:+ start:8329 stop:9015 length:687 start_codon:yes stop_codon:yes gene_type:complete